MANSKTPEQLIDTYEKAVTEDAIGLWEVVGDAKTMREIGDDNVRAVTLDLVRRMLARGFRAGNLAAAGGFNDWPDQNPVSVIRRIEAEWDELGHSPSVNDICWFNR